MGLDIRSRGSDELFEGHSELSHPDIVDEIKKQRNLIYLLFKLYIPIRVTCLYYDRVLTMMLIGPCPWTLLFYILPQPRLAIIC